MLKELLKQNRSYRGFNKNRRITKEELLELVEYTRLCPSSANMQALKYYLAWDSETVGKIQPLTKWAGALPERNLPDEDKRPTAFIIICQDTDISPNPTTFLKDTGIVAQTMLLAAAEKGLGGCMIGSFPADGVKTALSLAEHLTPLLVLALGEPAEEIVLEDAAEGESVKYYRDAQDVHHVPKRTLKELVI